MRQRPRSLSFAVLAAASVAALVAACGRSNLDELASFSAGGAGGGSPTTGTHSGTSTATFSSTSSTMPSTTTDVGPTTTSSSMMSTTSTSSSMSCVTDQDCADTDNCTTDACKGGLCVHTPRDDDGDGFVSIACGGDDCNDENPNVHPGLPENCFDGADNDCNGVADCLDPACFGVPNCGCKPNPNGENCTNGVDDDCNGKVDCFDPACQGTPACGCAPSETICDDGFDNDCDGLIDCDDPDCFNSQACQCKAQIEDCQDGIDNDCDGLIDCADPDCAGIGPCGCFGPPSPEVCNDFVDNDCDGLVDCADPDCFGSPFCQMCTTEICNDGIDNNCDGKIDCADPSCAFDPHCAPTAEICNNGIDDDHDGLIDCEDPDCANNPLCVTKHENCLSPTLITGSGTFTGDTTGHPDETEGSCGGKAGEADYYFVLSQPAKVHLDSVGTSFDSVLYVRSGECNHGREIGCDDDSAGNHNAQLDFNILYPGTYYVFLDGFEVDPNFGSNSGPYQLNVTFTSNPPEICDDGIDNDGDHFVDCADPDCVNAPNCFLCNNGKPPTPEFGEAACTDGEDNDCDGKIDAADSDCAASTYYVTEKCDGLDENGNGIVDDFNCRCADDSLCPQGQFCYTHTVFACGDPCTDFFGDICQFVAPGSVCNQTTQQCEFP